MNKVVVTTTERIDTEWKGRLYRYQANLGSAVRYEPATQAKVAIRQKAVPLAKAMNSFLRALDMELGKKDHQQKSQEIRVS